MEIKAIVDKITNVKADAIIINYLEGTGHLEGDIADVDKLLDGALSRLISQGEIKGKLNELTVVHTLGKLPAERVAISGLGKAPELSANKIRGAVAETCRWLRQKGIADIATVPQGADTNGISPASSTQAITEGALLGLYTFRKHITKKENDSGEIKQLLVVGSNEVKSCLEQGITRGRIIAEAVNFARDMVNEPANYMTPTHMAEAAKSLAGSYGLEVTILEREQMSALGMGALLGVAQGSRQPPKFIILHYRGSSSAGIDIALVGKGITFDSGGISIKPSERLNEMKGDMSGGAAVIAAASAIARLKPKINVTAIVPATENMPDGNALKPGDILTTITGRTIEIITTDAEGRLILADALGYAKKLGAKYIVDVATLTGACRIALGDICTGAFGNKPELMDKVLAAGTEAGEHLWQLPMFDEYREQIKSNVADIKNSGGRYAGAITAAKFLAEFIDDTPWLHLDIAGTSLSEKEHAYTVKGATGVPVRTLINLVLSLAEKQSK